MVSDEIVPVTVYFVHELDESVSDPVTAVFTDSLGEEGPGAYTVYAHMGQHSTGSPEWIAERTRPATPEEYADLLSELTGVGYRVSVVNSI
jgi:hypothetical protein